LLSDHHWVGGVIEHEMKFFVEENSVVRKIWGRSDTVLFIFAGAAAEFALNKAVDWLYFTGRLPADPIGRLFSTVSYARKIVFSSADETHKTIDIMRQIHTTVEQHRGATIPDWAYRDVLFMLIHYSVASYELLERKMSDAEKEEVYHVFYRVGERMGLKELPNTYTEWLPVRMAHLMADLQMSDYTIDLFKQYKKHLGPMRFKMLIESQKLVVPDRVKELLHLGRISLLAPVVPVYQLSRLLKLDGLIRNILLPSEYKEQINTLDVHPV
jgi:hypothetical protein